MGELVMVAFRSLASDMFERLRLGKMLGWQFNGKRDIYTAFGYDETISVKQYRDMYARGGLAGRIVDVFPKATWRGGVELWEDKNPENETEFEKAWDLLADRLSVISTLEAADILSLQSTYAIIVIGVKGGSNLAAELEKGSGQEDILYFKQYLAGGAPDYRSGVLRSMQIEGWSEVDATVKELELNPAEERFGLPKSYEIRGVSADGRAVEVHWSRVIHVADSPLENPLYSAPRLERVWNLIQNLEKVTGGGSEAFFQRANGGRVWSFDKDMGDLTEPQREGFAKQIEDFQNNIVRDVKARGLNVTQLGSDVAHFGPNADAVITQIAGSLGIPKRILTGSEMGELASSEDRDNWRDQVNGRRQQYAFPLYLRQLVDRLIEYGYLPEPGDTYFPKWGAVMNLTEEERRNKATGWASMKTEEGQVFANAEIRAECYDKEPLTDQQKADILAEREARQPKPAPGAASGFPRAAEELDPDTLSVLEHAIVVGNTDVVLEICGLGGELDEAS